MAQLNKTLMAVGAHADDIELNVGGTSLKYLDKGYRIIYVMATNNMSGGWSEVQADGSIEVTHPSTVPMMKRRKAEAAAGAKILGTEQIHLDHPQRHYNGSDGNMVELRYGCVLPEGVPPDAPTIVTAHEHPACRQVLIDLMLKHRPEWVLTHGVAQQDIEHMGTSLLVSKSHQDAVEQGYEGGLLHWREANFRFLGEGNNRWETFVDISGLLERKVDLIAVHVCQIPNPTRPDFPPRARALAWGQACGCEAAEVFTVAGRGQAVMLK